MWMVYRIQGGFGFIADAVGANILQLLSFFGILFTIVVSLLSLSLQRGTTARESLEQLDDLECGKSKYWKIRPLLYEYPLIPGRTSIVKLKLYTQTEVAGISGVNHAFVVFPSHIFEEFDVTPVEDGYKLRIQSTNAVKIRKETDALLTEMGMASREEQILSASFENFEKNYQDSLAGDLVQIHHEILDILETGNKKTQRDIRGEIRDIESIQPNYIRVAIADLVEWGYVEVDDSETKDRFTKISQQ